jgi:hypothetical protein
MSHVTSSQGGSLCAQLLVNTTYIHSVAMSITRFRPLMSHLELLPYDVALLPLATHGEQA